MIRIILNGNDETIAPGTTIRQLLAAKNLAPEKVAIELNRRLVRQDHYDAELKEGDQVEIVTFVGGG